MIEALKLYILIQLVVHISMAVAFVFAKLVEIWVIK